jgi:hypothetical protein
MARDPNPNKVKRSEVDEVFMAQAGELQNRRGRAKKDSSQIREANLIKASEIVSEAEKKKKGKK